MWSFFFLSFLFFMKPLLALASLASEGGGRITLPLSSLLLLLLLLLQHHHLLLLLLMTTTMGMMILLGLRDRRQQLWNSRDTLRQQLVYSRQRDEAAANLQTDRVAGCYDVDDDHLRHRHRSYPPRREYYNGHSRLDMELLDQLPVPQLAICSALNAPFDTRGPTGTDQQGPGTPIERLCVDGDRASLQRIERPKTTTVLVLGAHQKIS
mmetsp:Transcript_10678/g.17196  ORF Transcript_10678/g.17196 Transcript_10678/m.17196 type:complete len:209 (-) Transcript_10678:358-984(-)